jgi:hypothetical protein
VVCCRGPAGTADEQRPTPTASRGMDYHPSRRPSERAGGAAMLSAGGLLAACGSDDDGGGGGVGAGGSTSAEGVRDGGSLRVGVSGGASQDTIDAHTSSTDPDIARTFQLYEPLAIRNPDYELEMVLAESIEAGRSPDEWTIRLRDGIKFHNGKRVTADDVLFSLRRITDPEDPKRGLPRSPTSTTGLQKARCPHGAHQASDPERRLPGRRRAVLQRHCAHGLRPEEPGGHRSVQVQELRAGPAQRVRQEPGLLAGGRAARR